MLTMLPLLARWKAALNCNPFQDKMLMSALSFGIPR